MFLLKIDIIREIVDQTAAITGFAKTPILLSLYTLISILIIKILYEVLIRINAKIIKDEKHLYIFNKKLQILKYILYLMAAIIIWKTQIKGVITLISFMAAAITLALKDIIANFFAGVYISLYKPFRVEDRVELNQSSKNIVGDVVNINSLYFEVLEVDKEQGEQSTGIIVQIPNSIIFTNPVKNYTKAFKYVWNELEINVDLNADLSSNKKALYDIVNGNDIVKKIPSKMKKELNSVIGNYRIYYNNLDPIIYTKMNKDYVTLTIRYLAHPKKARNIESQIWNEIYKASKDGKIELYLAKDIENKKDSE